MTTKINIKLKDDKSVVPTRATTGSAGFDVYARVDQTVFIAPGETKLINLGFSLEVPENMMLMLTPRSGNGAKRGMVLGNLVGIIDSDYREGVMAAIWNRNFDGEPLTINDGDRIAQGVFVPVFTDFEFNRVDDLNTTDRTGGFGSTGTK